MSILRKKLSKIVHYLFFLIFWLTATLTLAEPSDNRVLTPDEARNIEILQLEKTMARLSQESQAAYQQFLMTQEMRRNEMAQPIDPVPFNPTGKSIPVPNYEDMIQRRKEKDERLTKYAEDLDQLYSRYQSLEMEREGIFQRIRSLEQKKAEE